VSNAIYTLGYDFELVNRAEELPDLTHLIIPGVGAFQRAAQNLTMLGLTEPLRSFAASGRPVLGLCLGMQLLASDSEEGQRSEGLGLIPGSVQILPVDRVESVPHIGWNSLDFRREHPLLNGVRNGVDVYFVHSFHFVPANDEHILATTDCGHRFASAVASDNIFGFQFHPEKSQVNGLRLLENFCSWSGGC
jgi:imidazole glycerol-phosphate synthase subunit HisH